MVGRGLLVLALIGTATGVLAGPAAAAARTAPAVRVATTVAAHDSFTHRLTVKGWAENAARPRAAVAIAIYAGTRRIGTAEANRPSPYVDAAYHLRGRHAFVLVVTLRNAPARVTARTIRGSSPAASRRVRHVTPSAGQRIVDVARRYVGFPYREGGASPRGFDCSGFSEYVYAQAHVHALPHNAESQRRMAGMRRIPRSAARPGDLVFYLSGAAAFHVAIYAGRGMQFAAATPRDGVRYQEVWSSNVQYATDWH